MSGYKEVQPTDYMSAEQIVDHHIQTGFLKPTGFDNIHVINLDHFTPGQFNAQLWRHNFLNE